VASAPELHQQYHVMGSGDVRNTAKQTYLDRAATVRALEAPVQSLQSWGTRATAITQQAAQAQAVPLKASNRRRLSAEQEQLEDSVFELQQQRRDAVTGFVGPAAMEQTFRVLLNARQATAFVMVEVQDAHRAALTSPLPGVTLLRRLSATLRASLREKDLICRSGPATFVLVLPGVRRDTAEKPLQRLRAALVESCGLWMVGLDGRLAIGVAFWEVGLEPAAVLAQCQMSVRRTRGA
jgi:GGDEF domain-containing protein